MEQEQTRFILSDEDWHQLRLELDAPPRINSLLLKLLLEKPIFKSGTHLVPGSAHDDAQRPQPERE